jgi:hypothetical protein
MLSLTRGPLYETTDKKSIRMACQEIQFVTFKCMLSVILLRTWLSDAEVFSVVS